MENIFKSNSNNIIINGVRIQTSGNSVSIINDSVYVDGELVKGGLQGTVKIQFEGDLASLTTHGNAEIKGNVKGNVDAGGYCKCGDVEGGVDAGGDVQCGDVNGDVDAGGSVKMVRR